MFCLHVNVVYGIRRKKDTAKPETSSATVQGRSKNKKIGLIIRSIVSVIVLGLLFGFLMNKATVFITPTIRKQMLFQRFVMLKMFLAAVGVSMLSVAVLELVRKNLYTKVLVDDIEDNCRRGGK